MPSLFIILTLHRHSSSSNEDLVDSVDVVFVGLLPGPARDILPLMPFHGEQLIVSMMAAMDINEVIALVGKVDRTRVVRTVPLPSNSLRSGPILLHPSNVEAVEILSIVGTPVICNTEGKLTETRGLYDIEQFRQFCTSYLYAVGLLKLQQMLEMYNRIPLAYDPNIRAAASPSLSLTDPKSPHLFS